MGLFGPSKRKLKKQIEELQAQIHPDYKTLCDLKESISSLSDNKKKLEQDIADMRKDLKHHQETVSYLESIIGEKHREIALYDSDLEAIEWGLYKPFYDFANSSLYKDKLNEVRNKQKELVAKDRAAYCGHHWTIQNSEAQGKRFEKDFKQMLIRAFNNECDSIIEKISVNNFANSVQRINKISQQLTKLGGTVGISICDEYVKLKIQEAQLALDFQQKKQDEKERVREAKEREREIAKAAKELEDARKKLKKEQSHHENALNVINARLEKEPESAELLEKKAELEKQIEDVNNAIQDVNYREANQRAGYVYVISNIGSFGENVYKIGMTRRLEPQERIDELSGASVPFTFDVHAMIFSEDAPALEAALHHKFADKRVNMVNGRKEFFEVSLNEIKAEVMRNFDKTVEWVDIPEAEQYRQTLVIKNEHK